MCVRVVGVDPDESPVVFVGSGAEGVAAAAVVALGRPFTTTSRKTFEVALEPHRCGIVCLRRATMQELDWVGSVRRRRPEVPLLLVIELAARVASNLAAYTGPRLRVVWAEDLPRGLLTALSDAARCDPVSRVLDAVRDVVPMTPVVEQALRKAARAWPPIAQVGLLAGALPISRATLYAQWAAAFGGNLRPKDMLEWVLLMRAVPLAHRGPVSMAAAVGVDRRTLERVCERRLGMSLAMLRRHGPEVAMECLLDRLSARLAWSSATVAGRVG